MVMSKNSYQDGISLPNEIRDPLDFGQVKLIYRAEGNANLVLSLPEFGKVLRLPKTENSKPLADTNKCEQSYSFRDDVCPFKASSFPQNGISDSKLITSGFCSEDGVKRSASPCDYVSYTNILAEFFGPDYVCQPEVVKISNAEDRLRIQKACEKLRPAHRLDKSFTGDYGLLLPDATLLQDISSFHFKFMQSDTFAIEIKPKQGWKLSPGCKIFDAKVSEQFSEICRYCAMQYLKLKNSKISKLRGYCPIDLFSGKSARMDAALDALFECPQNNLRIFRNGNLIYGDHVASMPYNFVKKSLFFERSDGLSITKLLVKRCLLKNFHVYGGESLSCFMELTSNTIEAETEFLPKNCVLDKILRLQLLAKKNLDIISLAASPFQRQHKSFKCLERLLAKQKLCCTDKLVLSPDEEYLLGATALDCSVILAFQEIQNDFSYTNKTFNGQHVVFLPEYQKAFLCKVTVVDLDPKPDNHFCKYVKKTNDAYQCAEVSS